MSTKPAFPFQPVDEQVFDVVVFGAGYAGFAAGMDLHEKGQRVLLVDRRAALLWESGWAFSLEAGDAEAPRWQEWLGRLSACGGASDGRIDGAIAEATALQHLANALSPRIPLLHGREIFLVRAGQDLRQPVPVILRVR